MDVSNLVNKNECSVESLRYVWEEPLETGIDKSTVGCLNEYCCDATLYYVKSKYDYLVYLSLLTAILGFANYFTLVSMITYFSLYTVRRLTHSLEEKLMGLLMILAIVMTVLYSHISLPDGPTFMPYLTNEQRANSTVALIEDRFLSFDGYFDIFDIIIWEDKKACGSSCSELSYLVTLEVNKGYLRFNPAFD